MTDESKPTRKSGRSGYRNATTRLIELMFRATRRNARVVAELERMVIQRLDALADARDELEERVDQLTRDVNAVRALYYDTHDTVTGEHIGGPTWTGGDDRVT